MTAMSKGDRNDLSRLARMRARQAKTEADQRAKVLLAEVEDLITAEYSAQDELWAEAVLIAEEAARKANEQIVARCADLGIPARYAPQVALGWSARSPEFNNPTRRGELRKLAQAKVTALTATAKTLIDQKALATETELLVGGLETSEARAFLDSMPTAEQLMPALTLDDLGVKHWQPPDGAAAALLTPSSPADRRRRQILRAIEANPGASNRRIAEIAQVDHHTVAKYRAVGAGEIPTESGEIPTEGGAE